MFVHHTGIVVNGEVSRYLIDNEYVEYTVEPVEQGAIEGSKCSRNEWTPACESRRTPRPNRVHRRDNRRNRDSCPVTSFL